MSKSFNFGQLRKGDCALVQQRKMRPAEVLLHSGNGIIVVRFLGGGGELSIDYAAARTLIVGGARYVEGEWRPL